MADILKSTKPSGDSELDFYLTELWEAIQVKTKILDRPGIITVAYTDKGIELTPVGKGGGVAGDGMVHRGEWSASVAYAEQNVVTRGTLGEFICFNATAAGIAPESGAPYWHGWQWPSPGVWA